MTDFKDSHLTGYWLVISNIMWITLAVLSVGAVLVAIPLNIIRLSRPCAGSNCLPDQVSYAMASQMQHIGLSIQFYAIYSTLIPLIFAVGFTTIAVWIYAHRPDDRTVLVISFTLFIFGIFNTTYLEALRSLNVFWSLFLDIMSATGWILFPIFFYIFPDGQFIPRWTMTVAILWGLIQIPYFFLPNSAFNFGTWPAGVQVALDLALFSTCLFAQAYRYRRVSNPIQRQQTKWIVYGLSLPILVLLGLNIIPTLIFPAITEPGSLAKMIIDGIMLVVMFMIPVSIALAILRFRLWEIDLVIRRTIVYTILSIALAIVYVSGVFILQSLFHALIGQDSQLAVVASTLVIVAIAYPLRLRIQQWTASRLFRQAYNTEQTMANLNAFLRENINLDQMSEHLLQTVQQTMQPETIKLWLMRKPEPEHQNNDDTWQMLVEEQPK